MSRTLISKEVEFDAGHRVPNHASKCRNPHGHRYRVRVTLDGKVVTDDTSPEFGMVADFGFLKDLLMREVHDPFDHSMIVHYEDVELRKALDGHDWKVVHFPYVPTAENLARFIAERLDYHLTDRPFELAEVAVWETPTSVAYWRSDASL